MTPTLSKVQRRVLALIKYGAEVFKHPLAMESDYKDGAGTTRLVCIDCGSSTSFTVTASTAATLIRDGWLSRAPDQFHARERALLDLPWYWQLTESARLLSLDKPTRDTLQVFCDGACKGRPASRRSLEEIRSFCVDNTEIPVTG